jgi:hypothetical protein
MQILNYTPRINLKKKINYIFEEVSLKIQMHPLVIIRLPRSLVKNMGDYFRFGSVFFLKKKPNRNFLKKKQNRTETGSNQPVSVRFFCLARFFSGFFRFGFGLVFSVSGL